MGDYHHGRSASISQLDASLLTEGREFWEEAREEVMGGGLWENRFVGGVVQQAFFEGSEEHM